MLVRIAALFCCIASVVQTLEPGLPGGTEWTENTFDHYTVSLPSLHRVIAGEYKWYTFLKEKFLPEYGHQLVTNTRVLITNYTKRYELEAVNGVKTWAAQTGQNMTMFAIAEHPFLILRMFRRIYRDVFRVHAAVKEIANSTFLLEEQWPSKNDTENYSITTLIAAYFHDLDTYKFAQGKFGGVSTGISLSPMQALHLAYVAKSIGFMASAVVLTAYGLELGITEGRVTKKEMDEVLQEAIDEHDRALFGHPKGYRDLFTEKIGEAKRFIKKRGQFATQRRLLSLSDRSSFIKDDSDTLFQKYLRVCSGEDLRVLSPTEWSQLRCWFDMKKPTLPPAKMEILSKDPLILKIHDYSTPKFQNQLKDYAFKNLKLSEYPPRLAMVADLSQAELASGKQFSLTESQSMRIYSMIPGGHYGPLVAENDDVHPGDGIATLMIYLDEVKLGGRTAFPRIGISDEPDPGAALLWSSHLTNGRVDKRTVYGSCPVLLGTKWGT